jgi:hypothetical protein
MKEKVIFFLLTDWLGAILRFQSCGWNDMVSHLKYAFWCSSLMPFWESWKIGAGNKD